MESEGTNMELRQLQYFQEVCRSNSFTKAAANLFVAQPVITNAILKLEAELNVRLLNRTNKSVSLTAEGQVLWERTNTLLELVSDIFQEMRDFNAPKGGTLNLGLPPQIGNILFPSVFTKFRNLYPDLQLIVNEETSLSIISLVEKGDIEVGIIVLPDVKPEHVETRILFQQPIVLCVGKSHPLSTRRKVSLEELRNEKFIMRKPGSLQRDIVMNQCQKHQFSPDIILSSSQIQTMRTLVANHVGIAFFMEMTVRDDPTIKQIALKEPFSVNIGVVWKKEKYISKAAQAFINFVCSTCTNQIPEPFPQIDVNHAPTTRFM
jgi:DNA-binding transcriptional LysR family regulator